MGSKMAIYVSLGLRTVEDWFVSFCFWMPERHDQFYAFVPWPNLNIEGM
jgi:hypothetical protein